MGLRKVDLGEYLEERTVTENMESLHVIRQVVLETPMEGNNTLKINEVRLSKLGPTLAPSVTLFSRTIGSIKAN